MNLRIFALSFALIFAANCYADDAEAPNESSAHAIPTTPPESLFARASNAAQGFVVDASNKARDLVAKGFDFLGVRYRYGGNSTATGFDCSGLVKRVFSDALGLNLPRTAAQMAKLGEAINREDLKPGDLVFFHTIRRGASHVGIYLGENEFLHAPSTGGKVRVEKLDSGYWGERYLGARRLVFPEWSMGATLPKEGADPNTNTVANTNVRGRNEE